MLAIASAAPETAPDHLDWCVGVVPVGDDRRYVYGPIPVAVWTVEPDALGLT
ncbi:hypothetical protein [Hyphomicrobium methylovorum]|uniref:hypothetical protein n=1 Tax=Hyphomicrobium methylovorum TaxID=84 RepID=UPI0015E6B35A|nr:hypothetical protein [Hyphomicrobium methylovorum]